jgi:hypothetical protein
MNTIQINYDLRAPGRDYEPVYDYIKGHGTWCRLLKSCWLIRTSKTPSTVRDELTRLGVRQQRRDRRARRHAGRVVDELGGLAHAVDEAEHGLPPRGIAGKSRCGGEAPIVAPLLISYRCVAGQLPVKYRMKPPS